MKENRRAAVTCGLMTLMLFAALAVYMRARLEYAGTWGQTLSLAALFTLVAGGAMVFFWKLVLKPLGGMFGIYELLPAFIFSVLVIVIVSLCTAEPDAQITEEFDKVKSGKGLQ